LAGACDSGNGILGSVKEGEFLREVSDANAYQELCFVKLLSNIRFYALHVLLQRTFFVFLSYMRQFMTVWG
jgi:hypothetical protein